MIDNLAKIRSLTFFQILSKDTVAQHLYVHRTILSRFLLIIIYLLQRRFLWPHRHSYLRLRVGPCPMNTTPQPRSYWKHMSPCVRHRFFGFLSFLYTHSDLNISEFALQPSELPDGCFALRKMVADGLFSMFAPSSRPIHFTVCFNSDTDTAIHPSRTQ
jgi:hypothetical protein